MGSIQELLLLYLMQEKFWVKASLNMEEFKKNEKMHKKLVFSLSFFVILA